MKTDRTVLREDPPVLLDDLRELMSEFHIMRDRPIKGPRVEIVEQEYVVLLPPLTETNGLDYHNLIVGWKVYQELVAKYQGEPKFDPEDTDFQKAYKVRLYGIAALLAQDVLDAIETAIRGRVVEGKFELPEDHPLYPSVLAECNKLRSQEEAAEEARILLATFADQQALRAKAKRYQEAGLYLKHLTDFFDSQAKAWQRRNPKYVAEMFVIIYPDLNPDMLEQGTKQLLAHVVQDPVLNADDVIDSWQLTRQLEDGGVDEVTIESLFYIWKAKKPLSVEESVEINAGEVMRYLMLSPYISGEVVGAVWLLVKTPAVVAEVATDLPTDTPVITATNTPLNTPMATTKMLVDTWDLVGVLNDKSVGTQARNSLWGFLNIMDEPASATDGKPTELNKLLDYLKSQYFSPDLIEAVEAIGYSSEVASPDGVKDPVMH